MKDVLDNIEYIPCNPANHGGTRAAEEIRYLVYHYTGNDGDNARNNCVYYRDNVVKASAHYYVDDNCVKQSVLDLTVAWAVGDKKWNDCERTGGGKLYGVVKNRTSISIEMCDTHRNGELMATEATLANAAALGRELMKRYNIPIERVIRHFDVSGKHCPAYFMDEEKWAAFKARLTETENEEMKRFNTMREISDGAPWATETVAKLVECGALRGGGELRDGQGRPADMKLSEDMLRLLVINDRAGVYNT